LYVFISTLVEKSFELIIKLEFEGTRSLCPKDSFGELIEELGGL
jgi:hypothetical protein